MMAQRPRNIIDVASPSCSADFTPRPTPMITMAVLMNHSGRAASLSESANFGMKLPMKRPTSSARISPASPVNFSDQSSSNFFISAGVCAAMTA